MKEILKNILDQIIAEFDFVEYLDDPEIRNIIIFSLCVCLSISLSGLIRDLGRL